MNDNFVRLSKTYGALGKKIFAKFKSYKVLKRA
jgi:hypothetical protein